MGKASILAVAVLLAGASWAQLSASESRGAEARHHADSQFGTLASDAAHTGYAVAAHRVTTDASGSLETMAGRTEHGSYETTFTETGADPREVVVRSEGRAGGARHVVEALFRDEDPGPAATPEERLRRVPPALRYAMFSESALRFSMLPRVRSGLDGLNANVHTNGRLSLLLSASALLGLEAVEGFGTYAGGLSAVALLSDPSRAFRPVTTADTLASLRAVPRVPVRPFVADDVARAHRSLGRTVRTTRGRLRLLGSVELGTRESPEVLVVGGDLALVDVRFEGYGVIVVEGGVAVDATVTGLAASLVGRPEGAVLIVAEGPIVFNGAGDVQGHYLTNASATFAGAATLHGGVAALGDLSFALAPSIRYVPPAPTLTVGLPDNPRSRLGLVSVREWADVTNR